jgi:hypothetical protein
LVALFLLQQISFTFLFKFAGYWPLRLLALPGVISHELSHAFFAIVFNHKVTKISVFTTDRSDAMGYVHHTYQSTAYQRIGNIFISLAPALFGVLSIFALFKMFSINVEGISINNVSPFFDQLISLPVLPMLALTYLVTSVAITMSPSTVDYKNSIPSFILLSVILAMLSFVLNDNMTSPILSVKEYLDLFSVYVFQAILLSILLLIPLFTVLLFISLIFKRAKPVNA